MKYEEGSDQFNEYSLPGDEPLKHQWDTNVQKDWYRHLEPKTQKRLSASGNHEEAWKNHQTEIEGNWIANSLSDIPNTNSPIQRLPGKSLYTYYNKKKKK